MKRKVHSAKDNLDWTVRVVWTPEPIRPVGLRQIYSGSVGPGSRGQGFGVLAIPFSTLAFLVLAIPTMLLVLPLRFAGVMSWQVEAVTYPWGRRKPAMIKTWRVKGRRNDLRRVLSEIAAALEGGEAQPRIAGAEPGDA